MPAELTAAAHASIDRVRECLSREGMNLTMASDPYAMVWARLERLAEDPIALAWALADERARPATFVRRPGCVGLHD